MDSKFFIQLPALNFAEKYQFRLKNTDNNTFIFCLLRKKWIVLTPEEWVRQHVIQYLIQSKAYSPASIIPEYPVVINGIKQRIDLLVHSNAMPYILVECKKPSVKITQNTLDQAMRYNQIINAPFVYLTNGLQHIIAEGRESELVFHQELP
ncbi:MAG: type I restriction enzyme HsdR N-terminal domain-containing protein [Weeksellaceae bacterium]